MILVWTLIGFAVLSFILVGLTESVKPHKGTPHIDEYPQPKYPMSNTMKWLIIINIIIWTIVILTDSL